MPAIAEIAKPYANLDNLALTRRAAILPLLVDNFERVASQLRALNWSGARKSALVRIGEDGGWTSVTGDAFTRGVGFVALIAHLGDIDEAHAASHLRGLLSSLRIET